MPVVRWAEKVISRAKAGGMLIPELESKKETSTSEKSKK
jgi:hypothetical protein